MKSLLFNNKQIIGYMILVIGLIVAFWLIFNRIAVENQLRHKLRGLVESNQVSTKYEYLRQAEADYVLCKAINRAAHSGLRLDCGKIRYEAKIRVEHISSK